jgi:hypothetical protein
MFLLFHVGTSKIEDPQSDAYWSSYGLLLLFSSEQGPLKGNFSPTACHRVRSGFLPGVKKTLYLPALISDKQKKCRYRYDRAFADTLNEDTPEKGTAGGFASSLS